MSLKVMHYYTYPENAGGPLTYIRNIVESPYLGSVQFGVCYQGKAASAVRLGDLRRIVGQIKTFAPDILHVHGVQSEGFLGVVAGKLAKVPKILMTVHGIQIDAKDIGKAKRSVFEYFVEPWALRHSDGVYCVCDAMANRGFIRRHARRLLPTVHNFITDAYLNTQPRQLPDQDRRIIASVGRVSRDKGMVELEQCILADEDPKNCYWIIGSGEYEETMQKNLAAQIDSGKAVFWGQQQDVKSLLHRADIFLFLSHHENLSMALLEAAAEQCCCIATDVGGNGEVICHGADGLLVPACSAQAAMEALKTVTADPELAKRWGQAICRKVQDRFGEKAFSEKLLALYRELAEQ